MKLRTLLLTTLCSLSFAIALRAADDVIDITSEVNRTGMSFPAAIPLSVSGYSSAVDATLKSDLFFNSFAIVPQDKARYQLTGKDAPGRVEGVLYDPITKKTLVAQAFTGGGSRAQIHALADAVAQAAGRVGIAQTKIAFKVQPTGVGAGEIYVADYDAYNAQPITQDGVIVAAPAWLGHSTVLYTSYKFGKPDIFSQNLNSGARKGIARYNGLNSSVAASPDGKRLAMILSKSGSPDLYVSDADGGNLKQLTVTREEESSPCWAPDGQRICFVSKRTGRNALYTISADGGAMSPLSTAGVSNPTEPDWSPDGKYIIFTSQMGDFQICIVPVEGPKRGQAAVLAAGQDAVWAPNSRTVIFARNVNHRRVLSLLDVPSKQHKDAARISGSASQPSWAR